MPPINLDDIIDRPISGQQSPVNLDDIVDKPPQQTSWLNTPSPKMDLYKPEEFSDPHSLVASSVGGELGNIGKEGYNLGAGLANLGSSLMFDLPKMAMVGPLGAIDNVLQAAGISKDTPEAQYYRQIISALPLILKQRYEEYASGKAWSDPVSVLQDMSMLISAGGGIAGKIAGKGGKLADVADTASTIGKGLNPVEIPIAIVKKTAPEVRGLVGLTSGTSGDELPFINYSNATPEGQAIIEQNRKGGGLVLGEAAQTDKAFYKQIVDAADQAGIKQNTSTFQRLMDQLNYEAQTNPDEPIGLAMRGKLDPEMAQPVLDHIQTSLSKFHDDVLKGHMDDASQIIRNAVLEGAGNDPKTAPMRMAMNNEVSQPDVISNFQSTLNDLGEESLQEYQAQRASLNPTGPVNLQAIKDAWEEKLKGLDITRNPQASSSVIPTKSSSNTPRPIPTKNYLGPLSKYTPVLYRETNLESLKELLPGLSPKGQGHTPERFYMADTPELALGQGENKGVLVKFDSGNLRGQINTSKPLWEKSFTQGMAEYHVQHNSPQAYTDALSEVTIRPESKSSLGTNISIQNSLNELEKNGWSKITNSDGSITYSKPSVTSNKTVKMYTMNPDGTVIETDVPVTLSNTPTNPTSSVQSLTPKSFKGSKIQLSDPLKKSIWKIDQEIQSSNKDDMWSVDNLKQSVYDKLKTMQGVPYGGSEAGVPGPKLKELLEGLGKDIRREISNPESVGKEAASQYDLMTAKSRTFLDMRDQLAHNLSLSGDDEAKKLAALQKIVNSPESEIKNAALDEMSKRAGQDVTLQVKALQHQQDLKDIFGRGDGVYNTLSTRNPTPGQLKDLDGLMRDVLTDDEYRAVTAKFGKNQEMVSTLKSAMEGKVTDPTGALNKVLNVMGVNGGDGIVQGVVDHLSKEYSDFDVQNYLAGTNAKIKLMDIRKAMSDPKFLTDPEFGAKVVTDFGDWVRKVLPSDQVETLMKTYGGDSKLLGKLRGAADAGYNGVALDKNSPRPFVSLLQLMSDPTGDSSYRAVQNMMESAMPYLKEQLSGRAMNPILGKGYLIRRIGMLAALGAAGVYSAGHLPYIIPLVPFLSPRMAGSLQEYITRTTNLVQREAPIIQALSVAGRAAPGTVTQLPFLNTNNSEADTINAASPVNRVKLLQKYRNEKAASSTSLMPQPTSQPTPQQATQLMP